MKLNIRSLFEELNIPFSTTSKHSTAGWVQTNCPYPDCSDLKGHLGYNLEKEYFHCWKCGWHPLVETVALLANISKWDAAQHIESCRTGSRSLAEEKKPTKKPAHLKLPFGTCSLKEQHFSFFKKRGFPRTYIKSLCPRYNILATGPTGEYKLSILFPITHYSKLVSYQCRAIQDNAVLKYRACSKEDELYPIKHCLFGADHVPDKQVVITEGILDALKLGMGAVCTFGVTYSWAQVKQLADRWNRRYIFFDRDKAGQRAARKLAAELSLCKGSTYIISPDEVKDPGDMEIFQAQRLMKRLKFIQ